MKTLYFSEHNDPPIFMAMEQKFEPCVLVQNGDARVKNLFPYLNYVSSEVAGIDIYVLGVPSIQDGDQINTDIKVKPIITISGNRVIDPKDLDAATLASLRKDAQRVEVSYFPVADFGTYINLHLDAIRRIFISERGGIWLVNHGIELIIELALPKDKADRLVKQIDREFENFSAISVEAVESMETVITDRTKPSVGTIIREDGTLGRENIEYKIVVSSRFRK